MKILLIKINYNLKKIEIFILMFKIIVSKKLYHFKIPFESFIISLIFHQNVFIKYKKIFYQKN